MSTETRIRYHVLDANGSIVYRIPAGQRFQFDFTIPGPVQGGRIIDLGR